MVADGHEARLLDLRRDALGGSYDAVLANAVLHHLDRAELGSVLLRCREAVRGAGLLAFSTKEGDGEHWSEHKLGLPRHFTFWREGPLRELLRASGWTVVSWRNERGRTEPWFYVIAQALSPIGP